MRDKRYLIISRAALLLVLLGQLLMASAHGVTAAGNDYEFSIPITIDADQVDEVLSDFPVLINSTIPELATEANGGKVINTDPAGGVTGALVVPADFGVFADVDCSTLLAYEFEDYSALDGSILLHVKLPALSNATDTTIHLCYKNSAITTTQENISGVWSNNYVGVWHLAETSGVFYDSTSNNRNGSDHVSYTSKDGKIGSGQGFDGSDDYISVSSGAHFADKTMTLSGWVNNDTDAGVIFDMSEDGRGGEGGYMVRHNLRGYTRIMGGSAAASTGTGPALGAWGKFDFSFSLGSTQTLYIDGAAADTDTPDNFTPESDMDLLIGERHDARWYPVFDGNMDELRVSSVVRSSGWISTTYNNQNDPGSFYTIGPEALPPPEMADPSVVVPAGLSDAVLDAIIADNPEPAAELFAITDVYTIGDYSMISLAGLDVDDPEDPAGWNVYDAIWLGTALARENGDSTYTVGIQGSSTYSTLLGESTFDDPTTGAEGGGEGGGWLWFPWRIGTLSNYGMLGVHDASSALPGWKAVDFVGGSTYGDNSMPNMIYGVRTEPIKWICRDGTQLGLATENFYYLHLEPNSSIQTGSMIYQGQPIGSLITGSHNTDCGYTSQQPTSFHLHFGFRPAGNYYKIENWILNLTSEDWVNGDGVVSPRQNLLAEWPSHSGPVPTQGPTPTPGGPTPTVGVAPPPPPAYGGDSLWDPVVYGLHDMAELTASRFPEHERAGMGAQITSGAEIALKVAFVMLSSNFDLSISMVVFGLIASSEVVRIIYAIYLGIKKLIPMIG